MFFQQHAVAVIAVVAVGNPATACLRAKAPMPQHEGNTIVLTLSLERENYRQIFHLVALAVDSRGHGSGNGKCWWSDVDLAYRFRDCFACETECSPLLKRFAP